MFQSVSWAALSGSFISFHVPLELEGKWPTRGWLTWGALERSNGYSMHLVGKCCADSRESVSTLPRPRRLSRRAKYSSAVGEGCAGCFAHAGGNTHEAKWNATRYLAVQAIEDYATDGDLRRCPFSLFVSIQGIDTGGGGKRGTRVFGFSAIGRGFWNCRVTSKRKSSQPQRRTLVIPFGRSETGSRRLPSVGR